MNEPPDLRGAQREDRLGHETRGPRDDGALGLVGGQPACRRHMGRGRVRSA